MIKLHPVVEALSLELAADLEEIEDSVTNTYSLADAIREGSTKGRQLHGNWVDKDGSMCALSLAAAAVRARGLA